MYRYLYIILFVEEPVPLKIPKKDMIGGGGGLHISFGVLICSKYKCRT
jgi:hypothetical protein